MLVLDGRVGLLHATVSNATAVNPVTAAHDMRREGMGCRKDTACENRRTGIRRQRGDCALTGDFLV
jgi:hypothetical protein